MLHLRNNEKISTWVEISNYFPGRNPKQCSYRYKKIFLGKEKGNWTREDDLKLLELIECFGENFSKIKTFFPSRGEKEIQSRYFKKINPQIVVFTPEEDRIILNLYNNRILNEFDRIILSKKGAVSVRKRLELLLKLKGDSEIDSSFNIGEFIPFSFNISQIESSSCTNIDNSEKNEKKKKDDTTEFSLGVTNTLSYIDKDEDDMTLCRKISDYHEYIRANNQVNIFNSNSPFGSFINCPLRKVTSSDKLQNVQLKVSNIDLPFVCKDTMDFYSDNNFFSFNNLNIDDDEDNVVNFFCNKGNSPIGFFKELNKFQTSYDEDKHLTKEISKLPSSNLNYLFNKKNELEAILSNIYSVLENLKLNFPQKLQNSLLPEQEKQILVDYLHKTETEENKINSELKSVIESFKEKSKNNEEIIVQEINLRIDCLMKLIKVARMKTQLLSKIN